MTTSPGGLDQRHRDLQAELQRYAEFVVGAGAPEAVGVLATVSTPRSYDPLPGALPIEATYDAVGLIRVTDPDPAKAARWASAIREGLDSHWMTFELASSCIVLSPGKPDEVEALFVLI